MEAKQAMKDFALWMCRLLLGGSFVYAAITKLIDPTSFATDIDRYSLVPYALAVAGSIFLPWLELICGAVVIVRWRERGALVLLLGLCGLFGIALASAKWRGLDIDCGCFGSSPGSSSLTLASARDLGLGIATILLLKNSHR